LQKAYKNYELILFTSGQESYMQAIVDVLPGKEYFSYFLHRGYMNEYKGELVKDLTVLN